MEGSGKIHALSALPQGQEPQTLTEYEWVGLRDGLDTLEREISLIFAGIELRSFGFPANIQMTVPALFKPRFLILLEGKSINDFKFVCLRGGHFDNSPRTKKPVYVTASCWSPHRSL
jgi:hypothetical protein